MEKKQLSYAQVNMVQGSISKLITIRTDFKVVEVRGSHHEEAVSSNICPEGGAQEVWVLLKIIGDWCHDGVKGFLLHGTIWRCR